MIGRACRLTMARLAAWPTRRASARGHAGDGRPDFAFLHIQGGYEPGPGERALSRPSSYRRPQRSRTRPSFRAEPRRWRIDPSWRKSPLARIASRRHFYILGNMVQWSGDGELKDRYRWAGGRLTKALRWDSGVLASACTPRQPCWRRRGFHRLALSPLLPHGTPARRTLIRRWRVMSN